MTEQDAHELYLKLVNDWAREAQALSEKRKKENNPVIGLDGDELYKELDNKYKRKFLELLASIDE